MMSYGAGDSPTYYIDISPFIGLLTDDKPHNLSVGVAGMGVDHSINANWYISGNVQITLDPYGGRSTGYIQTYDAQPHVEASVTGTASGGSSPALRAHTSAKRYLTISGIVKSGSGKVTIVEWKQNFKVRN